MQIAVFGLGYVGTVSAACLSQQGHRVFGVDVNPLKVELINHGQSPIVEPHIDKIIADVVASGRLIAMTDPVKAVLASDLSLICVGTPSRENGSLNLDYVSHVARGIGQALLQRDAYHVVVVRSTMLPGSVESVVIPLLEEASAKRLGQDFGVCINPEFLREGSALADYYNPAFTLVGAQDKLGGDLVESLYKSVDAPVIRTDLRTAEMVKYASNAFHALKVAFANELGVFCKELGIDSHKVMEIFTQDTKLNISAKYLQPGFAFGGSCLPKDVRAIVHCAKSLDLELPVFNAILPSNNRHIDHAFRLVQRLGKKRIGILGLSFKAGTDDLRESPMVQLVETLLGKGYALRIYDKNVSLASIVGSNKQYIEQVIPHISTLLVLDIDQLLEHAEVLVIGNNAPEFRRVLCQIGAKQQVIDLVRLEKDLPHLNGMYQGICW